MDTNSFKGSLILRVSKLYCSCTLHSPASAQFACPAAPQDFSLKSLLLSCRHAPCLRLNLTVALFFGSKWLPDALRFGSRANHRSSVDGGKEETSQSSLRFLPEWSSSSWFGPVCPALLLGSAIPSLRTARPRNHNCQSDLNVLG